MSDEQQKNALIEEIQAKVEELLQTDSLSEAEKLSLVREALSIVRGDEQA
jgi:hypothetical protein